MGDSGSGKMERKLIFANLILTCLILLVGAYYAVQVKSPIQIASIGSVDDIYEPLLSKLNKHSEVEAYKTAFPSIVKITKSDLDFAKQNNLTFFEKAKEGDYLLNYQGMSLVYNFKEDKIINKFEQPRAPDDLLAKLYAHAEASDHAGATPKVTKFDDQILNAAKANNQQFFSVARSGDYMLEWNDLILIYDYYNDKIINTFRKLIVPDDFVPKLMSHPEVSGHTNENPTLNLLDKTLIEQGKTANAQLFGNAEVGQYLIQWTDLFAVYDYKQDRIVATFSPQRAPEDFLQKLTAHPELSTYVSETPRLSIITPEALPQLKEQFPNVYNKAKAGDYVVRYSDRLVIYNYEADAVVDLFTLQPQNVTG